MKTYRFANGEMPALGLGTWKSAPGEVGAAVKTAVKLGYRHFDCAAIYDNEAEIGQALAECFAEGLVSRGELWITSKLWNNAHAPEHVQPALDQTLARLQLDYLDLYLVHWPVLLRPEVSYPSEPNDLIALDEIPIATTWTSLEKTFDQGQCRNLGVSNFSVHKLEKLLGQARIKPACNQIELHPYLQQQPLLDFCQANHIHVTAYSPLGSPDRPEILKEEGEPLVLQDPVLGEIAGRHTISIAQVALAWAVQRGTSTIPKSVNPARLAQNLAAAEVTLSEQDMQQINALDRKRRYLSGSIWAPEGSPYTLANLWDEPA